MRVGRYTLHYLKGQCGLLSHFLTIKNSIYALCSIGLEYCAGFNQYSIQWCAELETNGLAGSIKIVFSGIMARDRAV